jgi:hypothetical protein
MDGWAGGWMDGWVDGRMVVDGWAQDPGSTGNKTA